MPSDATARQYATALFDLGEEHDKLSTFRDQLEDLTTIFDESEPFRHVLLNPGIEPEERRDALRSLAERWDLDEMMLNFLFVLLDNDRVDKLPLVEETFRGKLDEAEGNVRATVTSAVPLDGTQERAIEEVVGEMTGRDVILTTEVDESLIGGAVIRVDNVVYDGSVANQFERLKDDILREV